MNDALVMLVEDDEDLLAAQVQTLEMAGFRVQPFARAADALEALDAEFPGVVLSDVRMPQMDGLQLFRHIHALDPDLPVILLTGHGDVQMAVQALKQGVYDFLTKPAGRDELQAALHRALSARALVIENRRLRAQALEPVASDMLIGQSRFMLDLRETLDRDPLAAGDLLITGGPGSGKQTVARAIHARSQRRARPFVAIACVALDEARFDAELMGAGPGDSRLPRQGGRLEKAHRGVLYLDEVDALSPVLQARLLALIEAGEIWPAGAVAPRPLDLRIIASTMRDLSRLVEGGAFRADLYYRLSRLVIEMPPLSARREDIPALFSHFLLAACQRLSLPVAPVTGAVKARLSGYGWPGNLSELRQFAESHALGLTPAGGGGSAADQPSLADMVAGYEAELIRDALRQAEGNATQAMARLKLPRKTFYDKLNRHGIRPSDFRAADSA